MADRPEGSLPRHVTTPLLSLVTDQALDEDYRHAAERRTTGGARRSKVPGIVALGVLGLLLAVAAVESSQGSGARETGRASLVVEAQSRRELLGDQQGRLSELREINLADGATLTELTEQQRTTDARLERLRSVTGYGAVSGPGVRVVAEDPPGGDPADDMTLLLDGLWNAGAEAISLNGRRITALTRVASTGPAVSLDGRSLAPPYTLLAIGDPATMQARFAESSSGAAFTTLADTLLSDLEITGADDLELPGATLPATLGITPAPEAELPERSGPPTGESS